MYLVNRTKPVNNMTGTFQYKIKTNVYVVYKEIGAIDLRFFVEKLQKI